MPRTASVDLVRNNVDAAHRHAQPAQLAHKIASILLLDLGGEDFLTDDQDPRGRTMEGQTHLLTE
jgi:hypothetical protein